MHQLHALTKPPALDHPWVESLNAPLFVTTWPRHSPPEDIEAYWAAVEPWLASLSSPWGTVIDLSPLDPSTSTAEQRRVFADGARRTQQSMSRHCVGLAGVMPSALLRGIGTAVMWLVQPSLPTQFFATREQAEGWLVKLLAYAINS